MHILKDEDMRVYRERLEARLRASVPDVIWSRLIKGRYVHAVHTGGDKESWRELINEAREELEVWRDVAGAFAVPPGRGVERDAPQEIEVALDDDTRLRGEVVAELAAARPDVHQFRRRYLHNRLLSDEEVDGFLRSEGMAQRRLKRLVRELVRSYRWPERQARRFVLTGRPPAPVYLSVAVGGGKARIRIDAEAWMDAKEVAGAYRAAQQQLLGGDNRKIQLRSLEVVRFVQRQIEEHGAPPKWGTTWGKVLELWNKEHSGEWSYADYRGLRQAFHNACDRLMRPGYNRPQWKRRDTS